MSSPADPFSILNRDPSRGTMKPPPTKNKIVRYRPGKAPDWQKNDDNDESDDIYPNAISHYTIDPDKVSIPDTTMTISKDEDKDLSSRLARRREIHKSIIVEEDKPQYNEDEEEVAGKVDNGNNDNDLDIDDIISRGNKYLNAIKEQEVITYAIPKIEDDSIQPDKIEEVVRRRRRVVKETESEENKYEENAVVDTDKTFGQNEQMEEEGDEDEENNIAPTVLLKPVFVSKNERESKNKELLEEIRLKEEEMKRLEKKKLETKMMVVEAVRKEEVAEKEADDEEDGEMPNDDDTVDEANEYEIWKIRELKRVKRDKEEAIARDKEKKEIERRRQLTDQERMEENIRLGADAIKPEKTKYKFMQKYYHKGAFYQDSSDPIFNRDYNVAVGEDSWDKTALPKILQVRKGEFGKKGRSKYTHLVDQDTTNFNPEFKVNENIQKKYQDQLAGYKNATLLDRPGFKKK